MKALYCGWVRSFLDYGCVIWSPVGVMAIASIERIQCKLTLLDTRRSCCLLGLCVTARMNLSLECKWYSTNLSIYLTLTCPDVNLSFSFSRKSECERHIFRLVGSNNLEWSWPDITGFLALIIPVAELSVLCTGRRSGRDSILDRHVRRRRCFRLDHRTPKRTYTVP